MKRRLRDALLLGLVGITFGLSAGCFGRFKLTTTVYDFNKSLGSKIVQSLVMWVFIIIPVYAVASLADVLIFNLLEFFSGGGSVAKVETMPDGSTVRFAQVSPDTLRITRTDASGKVESADVVKVSDRAGYVRRTDGKIVGMVEMLPNGQIVQHAYR